MIRSLSGVVESARDGALWIDVNGFGLEVFASRTVLDQAEEGHPLRLLAQLILTDSGPSLYGFGGEEERRLFQELIQVKNIGGRMAMALLRVFSVSELVAAIRAQDVTSLGRAPGVGAKRAERICFELRPKLDRLFGTAAGETGSLAAGVESLADALEGLGFSRTAARSALEEARRSLEGEEPAEEDLLRLALARLQKR